MTAQQSGPEKDLPRGRAAMEQSWRQYDAEVRQEIGSRYRTKRTELFERDGYCFGRIEEALAGTAATALGDAPARSFRSSDTVPGYWTSTFSREAEDELNRGSTYRKLHASARWTLADVIDSLEREVTECLGTPWRTLNARVWTTNPRAEPSGPYGWHTDGMPEEIFKVMIYLTPLSKETGGIEFKDGNNIISLPGGSAGAWVLFRNSSISHRGIPGTHNERLAVELTLCRSLISDTRPRTPGENAQWPEFPWIDYVEGSDPDSAMRLSLGSLRFRKRQIARLSRDAAVSAVQASLFAMFPAIVLGEIVSRRPAPVIARKLGTLARHIRSGDSQKMAEMILSMAARIMRPS